MQKDQKPSVMLGRRKMCEVEQPALDEVGQVMRETFGFDRNTRDASYEWQLGLVNRTGSHRAESMKNAAQTLRSAERALEKARTESAACAERLREVQAAQDRLASHRVFYPRCACPHTELCGVLSTVMCKQCAVHMYDGCAAVHRAGRAFASHDIVEAAFFPEPQPRVDAKRVKTERQ